MEVTNNPKIVAPINDNHHVRFLPLNDLEPWVRELSRGGVAAVILECIQGVGGVQMATPEFAQKLAYACKRYHVPLICDEIQCGYGRSGKFFAHQWLGIKPDIITVAKGIANGFPMGAVLISPDFQPEYGQLGTTFGGNHLACAAALAVLDVMEDEGLVENAREVGDYLMEGIRQIGSSHIKEVRGRGLMIGIELDMPHKMVRKPLIRHEHCFTGCRRAEHPAPAAAAVSDEGRRRRLHRKTHQSATRRRLEYEDCNDRRWRHGWRHRRGPDQGRTRMKTSP